MNFQLGLDRGGEQCDGGAIAIARDCDRDRPDRWSSIACEICPLSHN
ncbi:hypothetical protein [Phormidium sp. CCY1219]|nr:hypothetical protein [Phormidium sp. CCY1219]MEB3829233.1 hypothetical protein [Phormidium sp. CCY1219]